MINIKKFDSVAEAVKGVMQKEALKGDQHKIDKNKNNKIDAHDFAILRGEKKPMKEDSVEEANNPFDLKNYKSQLKSKPGEKAGFDSKKISTGTVYSRKPVKDEPMKKEEVEQIDELKKETLKNYVSKATDSARTMPGYGTNAEKNKKTIRHAGISKATEKLAKEEVEQVDELSKKTLASYADKAMQHMKDKKEKLGDRPGTPADWKRIRGIYTAKSKMNEPRNEEVEQVDERTLTKGETKEKERIVKGMKKSFKGFKQRYGERAKSVMYATATKAAKNEETITEAKRPESDTVPFITNGDNKPLTHAKDLAKKSLKRLKSEMMGKAGTSE